MLDNRGLCSDLLHHSLLTPTHSKSYRKKSSRKRKRKTNDQILLLQREFENNPEWNKDSLARLTKLTGLTEAQVYKWGWDQKKKIEFSSYSKLPSTLSLSQLFENECTQVLYKPQENNISELFVDNNMKCKEVMPPLAVDMDLLLIQKSYRRSMEAFGLHRNI
ncbi:unnamed protein product [Blepharisma stoltei]|uniref:Homeobox domain-containing protein n=1 Tax=Blepharisma stoltei TaxID=1481888 RepID=A0AAU9JUN9_9CILI|nr:unnamed protein product [Blepharisma stoltei]